MTDFRRGWPRLAACLRRPDLNWDSPLLERAQIETCGGCPVRVDCLMTALDREPAADVGVWGGTSPTLRGEIRRGQLEPWVLWETQGYPYRPGEHERWTRARTD